MAEPTPYPEINSALNAVLRGAQDLLGERLLACYLHGSLAGGGFNPDRSDIDLVMVTQGSLPPELLPALAEMHARAAMEFKWAAHLECSYIPHDALRRYDPGYAKFPALRIDGSLHLDEHGPEWVIQRHVLREHGLVLAGPPAHTFIDPVTPADLRAAALATLHAWWQPMLSAPDFIRTPEYQAYAALTMARILYTVENGTVVSKSTAAAWAKQQIPARFGSLLDLALAWPHPPQPDRLDTTLDLIRYTLEQNPHN